MTEDGMPEFVCANLKTRLAWLGDGSSLPITQMFDADGAETEDEDATVMVVAGPYVLANGEEKWYAVRLGGKNLTFH